MSEEQIILHRLERLEKDHSELQKELKEDRQLLNGLSVTSGKQSVTLERIDNNLKWATGGIFSGILLAIGKFIVSGKLGL